MSNVVPFIDLSIIVPAYNEEKRLPPTLEHVLSLWPIALFIAGIEWVLGLWVLSGRRLPQAALSTVLLNGIYAVWMAISLARGLDLPNCGCYGVYFPQPLRWYSPLEDLVLVALGLILWRLAK